MVAHRRGGAAAALDGTFEFIERPGLERHRHIVLRQRRRAQRCRQFRIEPCGFAGRTASAVLAPITDAFEFDGSSWAGAAAGAARVPSVRA